MTETARAPETIWFPHVNEQRTWLLTNGETASEPDTEISSTGRKLRIAGTEETAYAKDFNDLLLQSIDRRAKTRRAKPWMPTHDAEEVLIAQTGFNPSVTQAELHVLKKGVTTLAWWRFKHPTMPIEALLYLKAGRGSLGKHWSKVMLTTPDMRARLAVAGRAIEEVDGTFSRQLAVLPSPTFSTVEDFVSQHPPAWKPGDLLERQEFSTDRAVVEAILKAVRKVEALDTIQVLDLRQPDKPAWLDLELVDSNVNSAFLGDLTDFLEGSPTVSEALRLYQELRECLRGIGLVLEGKNENDFLTGLLAGHNPAGVTVKLTNAPHEQGAEVDHDHELRMHLPTGTFIVDCSARSTVTPDEVAGQWAEARAIASITGEEDTLIAYAREVARRDHDKRARAIIRERRRKK